MFNTFKITVLSKEFEGILGLGLRHKFTKSLTVIISCYLPSENSPYGRNADAFYSFLLNLIYTLDSDYMIICGDLNARIGPCEDFVNGIDNLPQRHFIDEHVNQHGRCLLDFLHESQFCVVNGRTDPVNNDFTSVTTRGTSVVDYMLVPQYILKQCKGFNVTSCSKIVEEHNHFNF